MSNLNDNFPKAQLNNEPIHQPEIIGDKQIQCFLTNGSYFTVKIFVQQTVVMKKQIDFVPVSVSCK